MGWSIDYSIDPERVVDRFPGRSMRKSEKVQIISAIKEQLSGGDGLSDRMTLQTSLRDAWLTEEWPVNRKAKSRLWALGKRIKVAQWHE